MLPMALPAAAVAALALGQVTIVFRDGQSPTPAYAGTRDVSIWDGARVAWQPDVNHDTLDDQLGGAPDSAAVLLRFDLSSVPPGTPLRSAALQVRLSSATAGQPFSVYQCLKPWTPAGATWNRLDGTALWAEPGATAPGEDRAAAPVGSLPSTRTGYVTVPLGDAGLALAQAWVDGSAPNHGFVIQEYATDAGAAFDRFGGGSPERHPALILGLADGGTLTVDAGTDTTIASGRDPKTVNGNGGGLNADGSPLAATLISFDVSAIPPWSTVSAAALLMPDCDDGTALPYSIYEAFRPWTETGATWNTFDTGMPWAAPGANGPNDHGTAVLGTLIGTGSLTAPLNATGVARVQDWVRGADNNGLEIVEYSLGGDGIWCDDREDTTVADRPGFQVLYTEGRLSFANQAGAGGMSVPLGPFTVERRRLDGLPISSGAPAATMLATTNSFTAGFANNPAASTWTPTWNVTFPSGSSASDPFWMRDPLPGRPTVTVSGGAAWQTGQQVQSVRRVRLDLSSTTAVAGGSVTATVTAVDSADVTSPVDLSAWLVTGFPGTVSFTATEVGTPGGTAASGVAASGSAAFTFRATQAGLVLFCASVTSAVATEQCATITFAPGVPDHLSLTLASGADPDRVVGCAPEDLLVQVVDSEGNPVGLAADVNICGPITSSLVVGASTLANETRTNGCVSGTLDSTGEGRLKVTPLAPIGVSFSVDSSSVSSGAALLSIQWVPGPPSLTATTLAPRDGVEPMVLSEGGAPAVLRLTPRDECGFRAPASSINVIIPTPMVGGTPQSDTDAGAIDFPVSLPTCPRIVEALEIRARAGDQFLQGQDGGVRSVVVEPRCGTQQQVVGCACASGPGAGQGAVAVLLAVALGALEFRSPRRRRAVPPRR